MIKNRVTLRNNLKIFMSPLSDNPDGIKEEARRMLKAKYKILAKPTNQIPKCRVQFHIELRFSYLHY